MTSLLWSAQRWARESITNPRDQSVLNCKGSEVLTFESPTLRCVGLPQPDDTADVDEEEDEKEGQGGYCSQHEQERGRGTGGKQSVGRAGLRSGRMNRFQGIENKSLPQVLDKRAIGYPPQD